MNALANCFWKVSPSQVPVPCCVSEWYSVWYPAADHMMMQGDGCQSAEHDLLSGVRKLGS